jgi:hypothetical protein
MTGSTYWRIIMTAIDLIFSMELGITEGVVL